MQHRATDRRDEADRGSQAKHRYRVVALELTREAQRLAGDAEPASVQSVEAGISKPEGASAPLLRLRVCGDSMVPLLRPGDAVWVEPVMPSALKRGDLVVVQREGSWITHRLVVKSGSRWYTKGDNLRHPDPPVTEEAVLGRVVAIERDGQRIELRGFRWQVLNRTLGWIGWVEVHCFTATQRVKHRLFGGQAPSVLRALSRLVTAPPRWLMRFVLQKLGERMLG